MNDKDQSDNLTDEASIVHCDLCSKWVTRPRCLPCVHSFCEKCLQSYVQETSDNEGFRETDEEKLAVHYRCPACNYQVLVSDTEVPVSAWPKQLPRSRLLVTIVEKLSLERAKNCDPCARGSEEKDAVSWCRDCGEALCHSCTTYHARVKILMEHAVFSLDEIRTQPRKIAETEETCPKHNCKNVDAVCQTHDKLCCMDCVTYDHNDCKQVIPLTDASQGIKGSKEITNLLFKIKSLDNQSVSVIKTRADNMAELQKQQETLLTEVTKIREEIIKHLNEMEEKFRIEFNIMHTALLEELEIQGKEFGYVHKSLNNGEKVLNVSLSHGSNEQVFVTAYKLRKLCELHELFLKSESRRIYHHDYEMKLDPTIENFTDKMSSIARINITKSPTNTVPTFMKDMAATGLGDIRGRSSTDTSNPWFTSGLFLPNGNLILVDNRNKKLKCFGLQDDMISELLFDCPPWGVAFFENDTLIVTTPDRPLLRFVTVIDGSTLEMSEKTMTTIAGCHSIQVSDDKLIIACSTEVRVMSRDGSVERVVEVKDRGTRYAHKYQGSTLCYTNKKSMVCLRSDSIGSTMQYSDVDLRSPRGFTTDKEENFYICGMDSNNIHQVSPNGSLIKILLNSKDGIRNPYCIGFETSSTRFFVTQMDSEIVKMYRMITSW